MRRMPIGCRQTMSIQGTKAILPSSKLKTCDAEVKLLELGNIPDITGLMEVDD